MTSGLLSLKWNNHRSTFFHVLSTIRHKESYNDATLACDGRFYPVHKLVLSTCSEYFEQMFERTQCKHPVIVLKDIKGDDLEALLNYMYIGEVNVLQNDLAGLIKAAECLRIKGLAVPDEAPNAKDTREAKRLIVTEESPQPKRRRREEDGSFSQSQSSVHSRETSHKEHSGISSPRRKTRLSQSPSSAVAATSSSSSTTSSLPSASQPPPSGESTAPAEESLASHPASEEEKPAAQEAQGTEAEGGGDKEREKGFREENSSHLRQTVPEVILDESVVKEEPQESADDIEDTKDSLHTGSSNVAFEHMGSDSVEGHDHMSTGYDTHAALGGQPQTMEELVAQAIPGSSGIQANSLPWDSEGNLANFPLESFGGDASQGRPPQLGTSSARPRQCVEGGDAGALGSRTGGDVDAVVSQGMGRGSRGLLMWSTVRGGGGGGSGCDNGSRGSSMRMMMVDVKGVSNPTHAAAGGGGGGLAAAPVTAAASGGSSVATSGGSSAAPSPPDPLGHRCPHCYYVAQNMTNLRKHTRIHTGEKPYACSWCPYRSTQSSNLKVHVKRHHPDQDRGKDGGGGVP